ncbi:hypothetical protein N0V90_000048 [Kalmusia sp. IMI 367209]|nr:hypothetical protein N0V90_000048 [Kalmusia sp. IMI 367209]
MAPHSITTNFAGARNQGLQIGDNTGSVYVAAAGKKSQLAIEHCYRTAEQSLATWVFWVHASNTARLEQSYRDIADHIKARGRKDPQADVFKLVHDWLCNEKNGPWLLILDNADDATVLSLPPSNSQGMRKDDGDNSSSSHAPRKHLSRYLPPSRHGSILVTSRTHHAARQVVEDDDIIPIEPMHHVAAYALLRTKLGDTGENDSNIAELAETLDFMPLALIQAAAHIRRRAPRYSVQQYLEDYRRSDREKTSLLNQEAGHLRRDQAASNSILITWQISFNHLRNSRQSAADLLSLMSFFDRQGIHEDLLRRKERTPNEHEGDSESGGEDGDGAWSDAENRDDDVSVSAISIDDEFEKDVLTLRDYSFIKITSNINTFEMHSLVQLAMRKWLENEGQLDRWREQFIFRLDAELPIGEPENWKKCQALFPHARAALVQRPNDKESLADWASLLYKAAWYAWRRGKINDMEQMSTIALEVRRELFGNDNPETLNNLAMLGIAKRMRGKYEEAESMCWQAFAGQQKVLGPEHLDTLNTANDLAFLLYEQGKYEEAERMYRQTLATEEKVLGPEHPGTLGTMNNLALLLQNQDKYEEAERMNRQTLATGEKVLGPQHPDLLVIMSNLAIVLHRSGKHEEAERMHRRILGRRENVLGPEHPGTLTSVYHLAYMFSQQHRYHESSTLYERAYAGYRAVFGEDHPHTLACYRNYSEMLAAQDTDHLNASLSPKVDKRGVKLPVGKGSKLTHMLAKIRIRKGLF